MNTDMESDWERWSNAYEKRVWPVTQAGCAVTQQAGTMDREAYLAERRIRAFKMKLGRRALLNGGAS